MPRPSDDPVHGMELPTEEFRQALLAMAQDQAVKILVRSLASGHTLFDLVDRCVTPVLEAIGDDWEHGRASLSEVYIAGKVAEQAVQTLLMVPGVPNPRKSVVAVALCEDYHTLGKRMVQLAVQAAGYTCLDYGRVTAGELAERVLADPPDLVLVSALMLRSALRIGDAKTRLVQAGCLVPLCVGGAPFRFDPELWREVGADGFGRGSADALRLAERFTGVGHG